MVHTVVVDHRRARFGRLSVLILPSRYDDSTKCLARAFLPVISLLRLPRSIQIWLM